MQEIVYTCPNCGDRLIEGLVLMPSGDKPKMWTCDNCNRKYYENTEKTVFKPLKVGKKISGRAPEEKAGKRLVTDEKRVKNGSKKV